MSTHSALKILMSLVPALLVELRADPEELRRLLREMCETEVLWDTYKQLCMMPLAAGKAALDAAGIDTAALGLKEPMKQ